MFQPSKGTSAGSTDTLREQDQQNTCPDVNIGLNSGIRIPLASSKHNLYDTYLLLCVQCYNPDDGQRNCPKHVEFYSKNKFEKLVHLVGFITIYHDVRSPECQIQKFAMSFWFG
jgi:hypothetical protein